MKILWFLAPSESGVIWYSDGRLVTRFGGVSEVEYELSTAQARAVEEFVLGAADEQLSGFYCHMGVLDGWVLGCSGSRGSAEEFTFGGMNAYPEGARKLMALLGEIVERDLPDCDGLGEIERYETAKEFFAETGGDGGLLELLFSN